MKTFLQIYRWSMQMKLRMALYTFVGFFFENCLQSAARRTNRSHP